VRYPAPFSRLILMRVLPRRPLMPDTRLGWPNCPEPTPRCGNGSTLCPPPGVWNCWLIVFPSVSTPSTTRTIAAGLMVSNAASHADRLALAVGLDPVQAGWSPTVDNYLGRVPKARILEAVREAKGDASAQLIDHLKKPDMAKEAERLLAKSGWLPEPLRTPDAQAEEAECESDAEELPAYLDDEWTAETLERWNASPKPCSRPDIASGTWTTAKPGPRIFPPAGAIR
jgi:hypothetical protein